MISIFLLSNKKIENKTYYNSNQYSFVYGMNFDTCIRCTYYDIDLIKHHKTCSKYYNFSNVHHKINVCVECKRNNNGFIISHNVNDINCEYYKSFH